MTKKPIRIECFSTHCYHCGENIYVKVELSQDIDDKTCIHEWHADQDNDCNTCVKCGARQEIYVNDD